MRNFSSEAEFDFPLHFVSTLASAVRRSEHHFLISRTTKKVALTARARKKTIIKEKAMYSLRCLLRSAIVSSVNIKI